MISQTSSDILKTKRKGSIGSDDTSEATSHTVIFFFFLGVLFSQGPSTIFAR